MAPREYLTDHQCAAEWGISVRTWRSYVLRGYAPEAEKTRDPMTGNRRWRADVVRTFHRPGQGARTDRQPPPD